MPSGSLKKTNEPHGEVLDLADLDAALDELGPRGVDVRDDQLQALDRAGRHVESPVPSAIEHADPGGVSWTKRNSSLTVGRGPR